MTILRQQAVQLVQQIPEDQMPNIIQYLHSLIGKVGFDHSTGNDANISPNAFNFGEMLASLPVEWSNPSISIPS